MTVTPAAGSNDRLGRPVAPVDLVGEVRRLVGRVGVICRDDVRRRLAADGRPEAGDGRRGRLVRGVVIDDGDDALAVADHAVERPADVYQHRLVRLVHRIAVDVHGDRLGGLADGEVERAACGSEVRPGRRGTGHDRVVQRVWPVVRVGRGDGHRHPLAGRVGLGHGHVGDRVGGRLIIDDRAVAAAVEDRGVGRPGQVQEERFVRLVGGVADHLDQDGLGRLERGEREFPTRRGVVHARDEHRIAAAGRVLDVDASGARGGQPDGDDGVRCARIPLDHGGVVHHEPGGVVVGNHPPSLRVVHRRADCVREVQVEFLAPLLNDVAKERDRDGLGRLAGGEREGSAGREVVFALRPRCWGCWQWRNRP